MVTLWPLLLTIGFFEHLYNANAIRLDETDGGYMDLLVGIHPDVPPNETLVENLKVLLRSSSIFLHNATFGRVFFKQVFVQFPKTWPQRKNARSAPNCCFSKNDVRVQVMKADQGDPFSTTQIRGCGEPGDFIQLSSHVLKELNKQESAVATYAFVNQWAQYRYGVFYEHGRQGHPKYPILYCRDAYKTTVLKNTCSDKLMVSFHEESLEGGCHIDHECHLTERCQVEVHQSGTAVSKSSIMFGVRVPKVTHFCDSEAGELQHNSFAPNMQNDMCKGASTWDVIMRHKDFRRLPAPDMSKPIQVDIIELQQKPSEVRRAVLALDVSGSMSDHMRLETMKGAVDAFLLCLLPDTVHLAIVSFSENAHVEHSMEPVNMGTLEGFRDAVKKMQTRSATCIGCALRKACQLLGSSKHNPVGGTILLFTDGGENVEPKIDKVLPELLEARVEVLAMAMGSEAEDKLDQLAEQTKGRSFLFPDRHGNTSTDYIAAITSRSRSLDNNKCFQDYGYSASTGMHKTLGDSMRTDHDAGPIDVTAQVKIFTGTLEENFIIDDDLGNNTIITVTQVSTENSSLVVFLVDPTGKRCRNCREVISYQRKIITIPSPATAGTWKVQVESTSKNQVVVSILVTSQARSLTKKPIVASCEVLKVEVSNPKDLVILVNVKKGERVVIDANVTALVINENGLACPVRLLDDGKDPDIWGNDGTYSGYFVELSGKGRYSVTAYVHGDGKARHADRVKGFPTDMRAGGKPRKGWTVVAGPTRRKPVKQSVKPTPTKYDSLLKDIQPVAPFQRVTASALFKVTENLKLADVPPGEIKDLRVVTGNIEPDGTPTVTLTWTWPGAHMKQGTASAVEIRGGRDFDAVRSSFDSQEEISKVMKGTLTPLSAGSEHAVTLALPHQWVVTSSNGTGSNLTAYVAAQVINEDGLKSETSRVIEILLIKPSSLEESPSPGRPPKQGTTPAKAETPFDDGTIPTPEADGDSREHSMSILMWISLGIVGAAVVITIVAFLLLKNKAHIPDENEILANKGDNTMAPS
ncbi:calcium-activated chloride channel regulator 1-like [Dermacentor andersoni]|uniref:calcium-activated chloride channel regulator 1-like n=1 Tax=Dermacentor andersoni TaxID=34620 RepID=UPI002417FAC6|nr:calcium-activated chloride channel regulator 1-like [Dermacentor andersoni]